MWFKSIVWAALFSTIVATSWVAVDEQNIPKISENLDSRIDDVQPIETAVNWVQKKVFKIIFFKLTDEQKSELMSKIESESWRIEEILKKQSLHF